MDRRAFSVAVYARHQERILVIFHKRLQTWLPIGGEMEAGETPLEAAQRELREETGLNGDFRPLENAYEGVPPGFLGYEEHQAGSKGLHMNFVFVAWIDDPSALTPNDEYNQYQWIDRAAVADLASPENVRDFGYDALDAR